MARPHEMASVPGIMTTTWEDGTVTYMYPLSASRLVKHIFTGNYPPLQEDASKLLVGLQGKGVELIRDRDGGSICSRILGVVLTIGQVLITLAPLWEIGRTGRRALRKPSKS